MLELILGGARSGKSRLAEQRAQESGLELCYIATAQALDEEMQARIAHHQKHRQGAWQLIEEPLALAQALDRQMSAQRCVLVDCLTLWLTNLLLLGDPKRLADEQETLLEVLAHRQGRVILVSNETGWGVVPLGALSRRFVDESGRLHQALAERAERVLLCVAGLPMLVKGAHL